jgi:hypothetical protein
MEAEERLTEEKEGFFTLHAPPMLEISRALALIGTRF